jgi:hypothetical protein
MTEALLQQVRRKLNITWSDPDTDNRVSDIANQATSVMSFKLGIADNAFDFSEAGIENVLFLAYCLYLYNHCENEFDDNYLGMILQARSKHEVKANAESE